MKQDYKKITEILEGQHKISGKLIEHLIEQEKRMIKLEREIKTLQHQTEMNTNFRVAQQRNIY